MNVKRMYDYLKVIERLAKEFESSPEEVLQEALQLYEGAHRVIQVEDINNVKTLTRDLKEFIVETLKDTGSRNYNFVSEWSNYMIKVPEVDNLFYFRLQNIISIIYKKNRDNSKKYLSTLELHGDELRDFIIDNIFN